MHLQRFFHTGTCFIKGEILQSPMILYRSLLFIATAMNDTTLRLLIMGLNFNVYNAFK